MRGGFTIVLCSVGLHAWQRIPLTNIELGDDLEECKRCQRRKLTLMRGVKPSIETREQRDSRLSLITEWRSYP